MSWLYGHVATQSKTSSTHGTIRTDNPELLKLLQEVSPDNKHPSPRRIPADTQRKETKAHDLYLPTERADTEYSKNIKNLLNDQKKEITKSDHLKENIFISDSGDAKENSFRGGKETYYLNDKCNDVEETDANFDIVNEDSKDCFDAFGKEYTQKEVSLAESSSSRSLARRKTLIVEDPSLLSDISESDCETVGSISSELARLKTPSRSSLNADFEDNSLPSSPVHLPLSRGDKNNKNTKPESGRASTSVSGKDLVTSVDNRRRAGATPYYSNQRQHSKTPSEGGSQRHHSKTPSEGSSQRHHIKTPTADLVKEEQDNSDCRNISEVITLVARPAQVDSPNYTSQGNVANRSPPGRIAFQEKSVVSPLATTVPTSEIILSLDQGHRGDRLPVYSEQCPRLSLRSSQSEVISSRLQKLTKNASSNSQDFLSPRANIPYLSQRLKSQGDTGKRSASVSVVNDSLDSEILDIAIDSLDLTATVKKDNSSNYNPEQVTEQNNKASVSSLKDSLQEHSTKSKLGDKRTKGKSDIAINNERTPIPTAGSQKKVAFPDKGQQNQTTNHGVQYNSSANKQEQGFFPPLTSSQIAELEESEHREFVLRTNPATQAATGNHPVEGSSHHPRHAADSGSVRSSNRTTPSVKKLYIESPVFTKEEEEVYRFVTSRLEDSRDDFVDTYRELDMAALDSQEKYAARFGGQKRVRYMNVNERFEDTEGQGLNAEGIGQFLSADAHARNVGQLQQTSQTKMNTEFGEEQADIDRYETDQRNRTNQHEVYKHHPAYLQDQSQPGVLAHGKLGSVAQNKIYSNHQDFPASQNQQRNPNQLQDFANNPQMSYNRHPGLDNIPQAQSNVHLGLIQQGQIIQQGILANQHGLIQPGFRDDRLQRPQLLQRHQPNISQQPSSQDQQNQNNPGQFQENTTPPVRGLSLPTGPTYDPVDEEDLKREKSYQQGLRLRIEDRDRRTQQTTIPDLPENVSQFQHLYDPHDYVQDSLDDEPGDDVAQRFRGGFANDSLNMYTLQQLQQQQQYHPTVNPFRNPPPPLPQNFESINVSNNEFPGNRSSRLDNVNFDSEDYTDHVDIRQQRVNPQIRPRFYNPQLDHPQAVVNNVEYFEEEPNSGRNVANMAHSEYQRYEDRDEDDFERPMEAVQNRPPRYNYVEQPMEARQPRPPMYNYVEQPMEAVQPRPPRYNYVTNNKENLGKQAPKSYIKILETTREEKERLQEVFIHPKPKPKGGNAKKQCQDQGYEEAQVLDCRPGNDEHMTAAEQVWAQRSTTLAKKVDGGTNRGRRRVPGSLHKFNSDSSLSQTSIPHRRQSFQTTPQQQQQRQQQQQLQRTQQQRPAPDTRAFLTEMPTPLSGTSIHSQPVAQTHSGPQHHTELMQPITQHLLTQDGQRISVDVNLKLISPPSFGEAQHHHQYQQQPLQHPPPQYPPGQYPQPQMQQGCGRQYPAPVTSYDDSGGETARNGMPALEYPYQEFYDSDSNDYRHGSPRERYSADEALRILSESRTGLNPYGKIPPIGGSQGGDHPSSAPAPDQAGSYMEMYMKQKVKETDRPWYKVYGLNDYRRMQKEVRLGTLGPDLDCDAVKERREKMMRQQDYAKTVMQKNRSELAHKKPPAFPRPKEDNDILSRRKLAMEYAKSVPKPTVRVQPNEFNNYELASEKSPIAKHHGRDNAADGHNHVSPRMPQKKGKEMDIIDLDKLRQRYEEDKMNEAIIRRNTHSFNREKDY